MYTGGRGTLSAARLVDFDLEGIIGYSVYEGICLSHFDGKSPFTISYLQFTIQLRYIAAMTKRRTKAQIAHDNRAAHAVKVAAPIAALRAARRKARPAHMVHSAGEVVRHLVLEAGCSFTDAARKLEHMGFRTPRGGLRWTATQAERAFRGGHSSLPMPKRTTRLGTSYAYPKREPRFRAGENREWQNSAQPLWTKVDAARLTWWEQSTGLPVDLPRPAEPALDSRGRILKGRRFSKIRKPSPRTPP